MKVTSCSVYIATNLCTFVDRLRKVVNMHYCKQAPGSGWPQGLSWTVWLNAILYQRCRVNCLGDLSRQLAPSSLQMLVMWNCYKNAQMWQVTTDHLSWQQVELEYAAFNATVCNGKSRVCFCSFMLVQLDFETIDHHPYHRSEVCNVSSLLHDHSVTVFCNLNGYFWIFTWLVSSLTYQRPATS